MRTTTTCQAPCRGDGTHTHTHTHTILQPSQDKKTVIFDKPIEVLALQQLRVETVTNPTPDIQVHTVSLGQALSQLLEAMHSHSLKL